MLVERGADVNARSNDGWTPLMSAAYEGHVNIAKFLIDKGADVDVTMAGLERWPLGKDGLKLLERLERKQQFSRRRETLPVKPPPETHPAIKSNVDTLPLPVTIDTVISEA